MPLVVLPLDWGAEVPVAKAVVERTVREEVWVWTRVESPLTMVETMVTGSTEVWTRGVV